MSGFAAYGSSAKNAITPLVDGFGVDLFDDGQSIRSGADSTFLTFHVDELGCSASDKIEARFERDQLPERLLPSTLRLTYYDPDRDYQTGEARAASGEVVGIETQRELPAVIFASEAKSLAEELLMRAWSRRETITVRLPPTYLGLTPGTTVQLPGLPTSWLVTKATVDGFVVVAELQPTSAAAPEVSADGGRIVPSPDVETGPLSLALFDIPNLFGAPADQPVVIMAASRAGNWRRRSIDLQLGELHSSVQTAPFKSVLGQATSVLPPGSTEVVDETNGVDIQLVDEDQWLTSCDDNGLASGLNVAVLGQELLQFGRATSLGGGRFRLERLLRARAGTEWACDTHRAGDTFCLLEDGKMQRVPMSLAAVGTIVKARAEDAASELSFAAWSVRPWPPTALAATLTAAGELQVSWTRRSRLGDVRLDGVG